MFSRIVIFTAVAGVLFLPVQAQNVRLNVRAHLGYASPFEENMDSSLESGFGLSLPVTEQISLAFDVGYWKSDVREKKDQLRNGSLTTTPFSISVHYHLWSKGRIVPYVFAGTGMVFSNFQIEDFITIPEITIDQEVDDGMGFQAGAGSLMKLTKQLALYGELEYLYRKGTGTTLITDMNRETTRENFSLSLNALLLRIGFNYFF